MGIFPADRRAAALAGVGLGCMISVAPAFAASPTALVPHRAVYDLQLEEADVRSGISGIYGRMVYEMSGSTCDGYTVNFRFVTRIDTEEFSRVTDQQTTTHENLEAGTFRFLTRSFVDDTLDSETRGAAAHMKDGDIVVKLDEPTERELTLDAGKFPTEHMLELIEAAKAGTNFYQSHIYDGSESGDEVMLTTTVIGELEEPSSDDAEAKNAAEFAYDAYWPVTMAYFHRTKSGDQTPAYQISFKLYDNGVTRDLAMDYGNFVLSGRLAELEVFDRPACED